MFIDLFINYFTEFSEVFNQVIAIIRWIRRYSTLNNTIKMINNYRRNTLINDSDLDIGKL